VTATTKTRMKMLMPASRERASIHHKLGREAVEVFTAGGF
jgi:hypothetical protein